MCLSSVSTRTCGAVSNPSAADDDITVMQAYFSSWPATLLEQIFQLAMNSSVGLLSYQVLPEEDDEDILRRQCKIVQKMLRIFLHRQLTKIDVDFKIDMRLFQNFDLKDQETEQVVSKVCM